MVNEVIRICYFLLFSLQATGFKGATQDQTSPRSNTLFDDADDIQRQLDNEALDRIKYGRPKSIWVLHFPTQVPHISSISAAPTRPERSLSSKNGNYLYLKQQKRQFDPLPISIDTTKIWDYKDPEKWSKIFPECGGRSQSPINVPSEGLIKARGARKLQFYNYNILPKSLLLHNDGRKVVLYGEWEGKQKPLVYGGAAHGRRYLFYSLTLHWPSEHTIGGLQYPLESQAMHISAEYSTMEEALEASVSDPQAFLGIANIYKFGNHTQQGLKDLLNTALKIGLGNTSVMLQPLSHFSPPFEEYACYQGSLPSPPCTESVLWLVRGRTLSIKREAVEAAQSLLPSDGGPRRYFIRQPQPLNDRKIYLFK